MYTNLCTNWMCAVCSVHCAHNKCNPLEIHPLIFTMWEEHWGANKNWNECSINTSWKSVSNWTYGDSKSNKSHKFAFDKNCLKMKRQRIKEAHLNDSCLSNCRCPPSLPLSLAALGVSIILTVFLFKPISMWNFSVILEMKHPLNLMKSIHEQEVESAREQWIIIMQTEFQFNHAEIIIIIEIFGRFSQQFKCNPESRNIQMTNEFIAHSLPKSFLLK